MKMKSILVLALFTATALFTSSCSNKNRNGADGDYVDGGGGFGDAFAGGGGFGRGGAGGTYDNFNSGRLPSRDERYSYFNAATGQFDPILFSFDSFSISSREMRKVDAVADYLRRKGGEVLVAGFTDAIGTEEYNRGLGDRRAHAVSQALARRGVARSKIQTVSFGEELLADPSSPNSSRNRRVEFGIVR